MKRTLLLALLLAVLSAASAHAQQFRYPRRTMFSPSWQRTYQPQFNANPWQQFYPTGQRYESAWDPRTGEAYVRSPSYDRAQQRYGAGRYDVPGSVPGGVAGPSGYDYAPAYGAQNYDAGQGYYVPRYESGYPTYYYSPRGYAYPMGTGGAENYSAPQNR